jgi:hypothetical protein
MAFRREIHFSDQVERSRIAVTVDFTSRQAMTIYDDWDTIRKRHCDRGSLSDEAWRYSKRLQVDVRI